MAGFLDGLLANLPSPAADLMSARGLQPLEYGHMLPLDDFTLGVPLHAGNVLTEYETCVLLPSMSSPAASTLPSASAAAKPQPRDGKSRAPRAASRAARDPSATPSTVGSDDTKQSADTVAKKRKQASENLHGTCMSLLIDADALRAPADLPKGGNWRED